MKKTHSAALGLAYVALLAQTGCEQDRAGAPELNRPRLVFITAGTDAFWQEAASGIEAASRDFRAEFEIVPEESSLADADGMAFAPLYGVVQLVASRGGACFMGLNHYKAGRRAGALARESLPDGGKILIIGDKADAMMLQERRQGILDELTGSDFALVHLASAAAMPQHLDGSIIVALTAHDAVESLPCAADKGIKVIAVEQNAAVRAALDEGRIHALVTSQPYEYGYHAVRVLAGLARRDQSVLPKSGFLDLPIVVLRETASQAVARPLHSPHDSTLFPRSDAGNLDRTAEAANLAADRTAGERSAVR